MSFEKTSVNLGIPYVTVGEGDAAVYVCENGVAFTRKEFSETFNDRESLLEEYNRRSRQGNLFDFDKAKEGILAVKTEERLVETKKKERLAEVKKKVPKSIAILCFSLLAVSLGSAYISTLHTATYLAGYVDIFSAWVMSAVVTVYCSTAFEVIILFYDNRRYILSFIFAMLWLMVVVFSMVTTVAVFFDRYNFNVLAIQEENTELDSSRIALEILAKKEQAIRESIEEKKADMEYRRTVGYATTAVRVELNKLQEELQSCLDEQQRIAMEAPQAVSENVQKKETFSQYLGRKTGIDGGIIEFILSTLSAVFINLISPFSVTVVISLLNNKEEK